MVVVVGVNVVPRTPVCGGTAGGSTTCAPLTAGLVTISFDDGLVTQSTLARQPLLDHGVQATIYITTNPVSQRWSGYLSLDQVRQLAQDGHEITFTPRWDPRTMASEEAKAELGRLSEAPIGLYAHIPFCSQLCWYCGCNVTATRDRSKGSSYIDLLLEEVALVARAIGRRQPVAELALAAERAERARHRRR